MSASFRAKPPSRAYAFVFLPFFALGLVFAVLIVREAIASAATYNWTTASCQILKSEVRAANDRSPWFAYLRYTSSAGESVRSSRLFPTYSEARHFTRRWPAGSEAQCYLNPGDPAGALLERKATGLVLLLFLPLPLLFVFIGAAGFRSLIFPAPPKPRVPHIANPAANRRFGIGLIILISAGLSLAFSLGPVRHFLAARSWRKHECKILRSEIFRRRTSKGRDAFSPVILYSYLFDDREHRSDTQSFFELSRTWESARDITASYRPNSTIACYVNPSDPDDATLDRDPSLHWLWGLIPYALLVWGVRLWRRPQKP